MAWVAIQPNGHALIFRHSKIFWLLHYQLDSNLVQLQESRSEQQPFCKEAKDSAGNKR